MVGIEDRTALATAHHDGMARGGGEGGEGTGLLGVFMGYSAYVQRSDKS